LTSMRGGKQALALPILLATSFASWAVPISVAPVASEEVSGSAASGSVLGGGSDGSVAALAVSVVRAEAAAEQALEGKATAVPHGLGSVVLGGGAALGSIALLGGDIASGGGSAVAGRSRIRPAHQPRVKLDASELASTPKPTSWYDGLDSIKVLRPSDSDAQKVVHEIWSQQESWQGHFNDKRYAILLTPGVYPANFSIPVSYYTSVLGVGLRPNQVEIDAAWSTNGPNGHATNNFWRSFEGLTLRSPSVTWAASQGSPIRRSVINGKLWLSDETGFASGGFMADVKAKGTVMTGMQQQWLFRNTDMSGGVWCPNGWNYVFVGVKGVGPEAYQACAGGVTAKVTAVPATPRIAEKPYLVQEEDSTWNIYVPKFFANATVGATVDHSANWERKLSLESDVFIAKPGDTAETMNRGIQGKKGLLITPGVYEMVRPLVINTTGFVVLGLGFATLIPTSGGAAVEVADGLSDVRIAGLLLEAGTPKSHGATAPLLRWGAGKFGGITGGKGAAAADDLAAKVGPYGRALGSPAGTQFGAAPTGVLSDVFARVGSFNYRGCPIVRADTMVEINSDDVVLDNTWLWHADHDDCGTDPGLHLHVIGKSDACYSEHGLVVNGDRVTAYGTAAEHMTGGNMVDWTGDGGEAYFYQSELPYHNDSFSVAGYVGYAVAPEVKSHAAYGMGVYIISGTAQSRGGYLMPPTARVQNVMTVVVIGDKEQFQNTVCVVKGGDGSGDHCLKPETCIPASRCVLTSLPGWVLTARLFLDNDRGASDGDGLIASASAWHSSFLLGLVSLPLLLVASVLAHDRCRISDRAHGHQCSRTFGENMMEDFQGGVGSWAGLLGTTGRASAHWGSAGSRNGEPTLSAEEARGLVPCE